MKIMPFQSLGKPYCRDKRIYSPRNTVPERDQFHVGKLVARLKVKTSLVPDALWKHKGITLYRK